MQHNKNSVKLYNAIFPIWFLLMMPQLWFIVLPGNFLIDSLVLIVSMYALKIECKKLFYKQHIFKIFFFGMLADILGAIFLRLLLYVRVSLNLLSYGGGDELYMTIPAVIVAGVLIYVFNYFVTFKYCKQPIRHKLALTYAIATAPYTFILRNSWF